MKKLLSLMMLMLLCTSAWAQEPTMLFHESFGDNPGSARDWNDSYSVKTGVEDVYSGITGYTVVNAKQGKNNTGFTQSGLNQSTQGSDASIVIGPLNVANYESLKLTYQWKAASVKGTYSTTAYYATSANGDYTQVDGTGEGATTFVERVYNLPVEAQVSTLYLKIVFNTSNTQAIIDEVNLDGIETGTAPAVTVAKPVIEFNAENPVEGDNVTCTITCATDGATIQYALNDGEYKEYTEPFTINTTTNVKAKAVLEVDGTTYKSQEASETITFAPAPTTVANIAALTALENGKVFRMTGSATVVYTYGNFVYIKDESGSTLLYDVTNGNPEVAAGYTISNLQGVVSIYNGLFEVGKPASYTVEQTPITTVDPVVMAVDAISSANVNQYVKLEGVSLSEITNNYFEINGTLTGRNRFAVDYPTKVAEKSFDVTGFVGINGETLQFWPTDIEDVTPEPPAVFGIKVTPTPAEGQVFTAPVNVTIELLNATGEEAYFDYYLDDVKQKNYPEGGFTLYKTTAVKVVATNDDEDLTEVTWEGTYNIELPDFTIEPSVATGTTLYKATDVTFTPKNGFGDLTIIYTVNNGQTQEASEAFTVNVAENTTVNIEASDGYGREFSGEFTYTVDLFVPATKFKLVTNLSELEAGKQVLIAGVDGDMYVMGAQKKDNRYAVACSLGTALTAPVATLNLANVTGYRSMVLGKDKDSDKYTFYDVENEGYLYAASSSNNHLKTETELDDNGKAAIDLVEGKFSVVFQGDKTNKYMQFNSSSTLFSCYGPSNTQEPVYLYVEGEAVAPQTYTITLDKEPGDDYTALVNVKATVEPALPDDATLTFKINDADPKPYNPEKGVNMLESGTLTFTATDAAGNVLATKSAEYKYIMRVFGDLNGDGKVDVEEVDTVVNLILGKLNN